MDNAFAFSKGTVICTETSYPYKATGGTCQESSCSVGIRQGGVTGYADESKDSEQALMEALGQQPVSIAIQAGQFSFQMYHSDVLTSSCGSCLGHGVLAVGYGSDIGTDYWKVESSCGSTCPARIGWCEAMRFACWTTI